MSVFWRVSTVLLSVLMLSGCGVKLFYNNADRVARWWVSDYIDMTPAQRQYFDSSTAELMYWHRTTQLALYRQRLDSLRQALATPGFTQAQLDELVDEVEIWGETISARASPIGVQILLSLSLDQVNELESNFAKSNRDYERDIKRSIEDHAREDAKDYAKLLRRFVGRLNSEQRDLILRQHLALAPDAEAILNYRRFWQGELTSALESRPPARGRVEDLMLNFDQHYTPEFTAMIDTNELIYRDLTLELLNSLSQKQRERLGRQFTELIEICDELIVETPAVAPSRPAPLVP